MKKLILAVFAASVVSASVAQTTIDQKYQDGKIYFKLKSDAIVQGSLNEDPRHLDFSTIPFIQKLGRQYGISNLSRPFFAAKESHILQLTYELRFTDFKNVDRIVAAIKADPTVEYVERATLHRYDVTPNDPYYTSQWELAQIDAANAWSYSTGNIQVTVAIVDDAIEVSHPDLSPSIWNNTGEIANNGIDDDKNGYIDDRNGFDVADNDKDPSPPTSSFTHGTHVAGCAGARSNNSTGVSSIGYTIKIMPVKSSNTASSVSNALDGVVYAAVNKARVINMSWGSSTFSQTEQNIMDYAYSRGCVLVGAAGNDNSSAMHYPAALNHVISVGSTSSSDAKSSFSNYGSWIDVCAPGDNILSTDYGSSYGYMSGTSFSSPIVAGLCGLMLSKNSTLTQQDVENCLKSGADNIDGVNPSYVGQLGAGRINANSSMSCVNSTLSWKPTTNFYANFTTVTAGGKVTFTDSTIHGATTWSWTFTGGTPASFNGKIPPQILYNTTGTYDVSLTTSNGNGSDSKTRTGYIVVTTGGGCNMVNFSHIYPTGTADWTGTYYTAGPGNGFVVGKNNQDNGKQVAQYFDASSSPYTKLTRIWIQAVKANSATMSSVITINVYDGTSGTPGSLISSSSKTLQFFANSIAAGRYADVVFSTPLTLPASKKFFVGLDYSTLTWNTTTKDTFVLVSNTSPETNPAGVWVQDNTNAWKQFGTAGTWNANISAYIFPFTTDDPPAATFTTSSTIVCEGSSVNFNAAGSTYQDTLLWFIPGSTSAISNAVAPSVIYNTSGTYSVKLYVVGGGCHELDSAQTSILVEANPVISVSTSSGGTSVCPGGNLTLTASGGSSLVWSPSTNLNTSSGATVITTPGSNITYNVTGVQGSCSGSASINITIDQPISVSVTTNPTNTTFCKNNSVVFNASASTNVSNYTWSFPGGTPSSSNSATPTVNYATPGGYTATLTASNSCSSDNSYSKLVTVNNCVGVQEFFSDGNINAFYNSLEGKCYLDILNGFNINDQLSLRVFNHLGQVVYTDEFKIYGSELHKAIDMTQISRGIYTVQLIGENGNYQRKLMVE